MIKVRRLLLFILIASIIGLLTYIYVFSDVGLLKIKKLEGENKDLEEKLDSLRKENAELRAILSDDKRLKEYTDKKLKGELGMIKEGDLIILFDNGSRTDNKSSENEKENVNKKEDVKKKDN